MVGSPILWLNIVRDNKVYNENDNTYISFNAFLLHYKSRGHSFLCIYAFTCLMTLKDYISVGKEFSSTVSVSVFVIPQANRVKILVDTKSKLHASWHESLYWSL